MGQRFKDVGVDTRVCDTGRDEDVVSDIIPRWIKYEDIGAVSHLTSGVIYLWEPDGIMRVVRGYFERLGLTLEMSILNCLLFEAEFLGNGLVS